ARWRPRCGSSPTRASTWSMRTAAPLTAAPRRPLSSASKTPCARQRRRGSDVLPSMRLYVEPMDAVVVDVESDGRVRLDNEDWTVPSLQERRAILYAAGKEIEALTELIE